MLNEKLVHRALGMFLDRYNYFSKQEVFCQEHGFITEMDAAARASAINPPMIFCGMPLWIMKNV